MQKGDVGEIRQFFHDISPTILNLVSANFKKSQAIKHKAEKKSINFATQTDLDVEKLIVSEISKKFPNDLILAEENFSDTALNKKKRIWIIDPICGTANFAKAIKFFCTNIAVAENNDLVASCVIDHSQNEYIWSTGGNEIHINDTLVNTQKSTSGIEIEIDLSALHKSSDETKKRHGRFVTRLLLETDFTLISHATSLGFAYASLGRIDGYVSPDVYLWDIAAANFLLQQAGGIVTNITGSSWHLEPRSVVVASRDKDIHKRLLSMLSV